MIKQWVRQGLRSLGWDIIRYDPQPPIPPDFDELVAETVRSVRMFTQTSPERIYSLCNAVRYLVANGIPGAIVECGVWKGGSMMAAARTLLQLGERNRQLFLYDTFEGMPPPGEFDVDYTGAHATTVQAQLGAGRPDFRWNYAPVEEVRQAVLSVGYPSEHIHLIKGRFEDTLPSQAPERIALLRLDTDWYESTRHELVTLYPRIPCGGVLIVDDYGHFAGSKKAVDEYLHEHHVRMLLHRIDYTGRIGVVPS